MSQGSDMMSGNDQPRGYEVGFKRTPLNTRFKKGTSGNPSGRPRKKQRDPDLGEVLRKVLNAPVRVMIGGKPKIVPGMEAIAMQLKVKSSNGELPATRLVFSLLKDFTNTKNEPNEQLEGLFASLMAGPVDTPGSEADKSAKS